MRRSLILAALALVALSTIPLPAAAEMEKAVIGILGGMQCSL